MNKPVCLGLSVLDERNKGIIFKNCAPLTDGISEINNTQYSNR